MRKAVKVGIGLTLLVLFLGCNPIKLIEKNLDKIQVKANPEVLEVHGGKIDYSFKGNIPPKTMHPKAALTITPVVHYNGKSLKLDKLSLKGEKADGAGRSISKSDGGSFELSGSFDFAEDMLGNNMYVDLEIQVCKAGSDDCADFKKEKVALGLISTSRSVKNLEVPFIAGDTKPKKRRFERSIFFLINSHYIRSSEKRGEAMNELRDFVQTERLKLQGITINSFASPDGELRLNQKLTEQRSQSSYKFLTDLLQDLDVESAKGDMYKKQSLEEDWNGFRSLVQASSLPDKDKALQIINSKQSNDDKEAAIKELDSWPTILDEMMPKLRRSEIILQGVIENRSVETLKEVAKESFESFTVKELLLYAENGNLKEKAAAYKAYIQKDAKSIVGYNNLAAVHIMKGEYAEAKKVIENGINKAGANDSLHLNMGIVLRNMGENEKAMASYIKADNASLATGYNKSIIHIINGDYDAALESQPEAMCDYNTALANELKGQHDAAIEEINCQKEPSADDYYLRAIAEARQGNIDDMAASLRQAVAKDAAVASKAMKDMEFYSYKDRDEFKAALNK